MIKDDPDYFAIFRQVDGAPLRMDGVPWQAELWERGCERSYPLAMAWLSDYRGSLVMNSVVLDFILVPDLERRRGYATRLITECEKRWPSLVLTDPISPEGTALTLSLYGDQV